ncbi:polysaccharide biosynthesis/export family protein [Mariniflexile ostreae]|uniref:Polysaccharide biosynthesis/export family protein n=1 Tax=Mariniflexile ostreae TaxID=1520892 RepID=A0ABV5FCC8_9FLAO
MKKSIIYITLVLVLLQSCANKKDVLYFQDADALKQTDVQYHAPRIQPNDVLDIKVSALVPETALPYNVQIVTTNSTSSIELLKLQGYLVDADGTITFPVLGRLQVGKQTTAELEETLQSQLEDGGHLILPKVSVRLLNAKVTILGEVQRPGTYNFTEQQISLPQALGYAGDLTINGKRQDILIIRETDGKRYTHRIDLTKSDWFDSPYYYIQPNDFIVVNPNGPKVKSSGFVGNTGTLISVISVILTSIVLISK